MEWYYIEDNVQKGPVDAASFQKLAKSGLITPQTLVWHAGLAGWRLYGSLSGGVIKAAEATAQEAVCAECQNIFPREDMIQYGDSWVCGACKPVFLQKLKEGVPLAGRFNYAGFWIRAGATIIDSIAMALINWIVMLPFGFMAGLEGADPEKMAKAGWGYILVSILTMVFPIVYETWFVGRFGATPGKMAVKIRVICSDGSRVSYMRAFGRYWAKIVSGIILGIGYIMAGFDEQKRALHDRICDTRVVRT